MLQEMNVEPVNGFNLCSNLDAYIPDFVWVISGIQELLGNETFEKFSEECFIWNEYTAVGAQAKLSMDTFGTISASLNLIPVDPAAQLKPIPTVYYVLRDRSGRKKKTKHLFEKEMCHKSWLASSRYNVDDEVVLEVYVEPPAATQSSNGILNWTVEKLSRRKEAELNRSLDYQESPYFYTRAGGYRVQAWIGLNGYGSLQAHCGREEEGVMVELSFMTGEFDADLPPVFPHKSSVSLRSPSEPKHGLTCTFYKNLETQRGYEVFIPVDDEILMAEDRLLVSVVIEPLAVLN